jgi:hypothetical protein
MMMNHFEILAHGESLDVDALLRSISLHPVEVWRRRDEKLAGPHRRRMATSGISVRLSHDEELAFEEQDRIAIEYLEQNRAALTALGRFPGVKYFFLGLAFGIEVDASIVGTCVSISPRLMRIAGEIGMEVTIYIDLERKDWFG